MLEIRAKTARFLNFGIFLILCLTLSCESVQSTPELEKHFSDEQIKDLQRVNSFFVSEILKNEPFKKGIEDFYEKLYSEGFDSILKTIDYNHQKELYKSISQSTFDEIWVVQKNIYDYIGETSIRPKYNGAFYKYLEELSLSNEFGKVCLKRLQESGDYNFTDFDYYIVENFHAMDFEDFNNQLIISIYLLTAIDYYERDENRKKRIQDFNKKINEQFQN